MRKITVTYRGELRPQAFPDDPGYIFNDQYEHGTNTFKDGGSPDHLWLCREELEKFFDFPTPAVGSSDALEVRVTRRRTVGFYPVKAVRNGDPDRDRNFVLVFFKSRWQEVHVAHSFSRLVREEQGCGPDLRPVWVGIFRQGVACPRKVR